MHPAPEPDPAPESGRRRAYAPRPAPPVTTSVAVVPGAGTPPVLLTRIRSGGRVLASRAGDVLVQYVTGPGPRAEIELGHRADGAPPGLDIGRGAATGRGETTLTLRVRHPDGRPGRTGLALLLVDAGRTVLTDRGVRVEGAGALLLLTRAVRHEGPYDPERGLRALRALAGGLDGGSAGGGAGLLPGGPAVVHARLLARHPAARVDGGPPPYGTGAASAAGPPPR